MSGTKSKPKIPERSISYYGMKALVTAREITSPVCFQKSRSHRGQYVNAKGGVKVYLIPYEDKMRLRKQTAK